MSLVGNYLLELKEFDHPTMEDHQEQLAAELREFHASHTFNKALDQQIGEECQRRIKNRAAIAKVEGWRGKLKNIDFRDFGLRGEVMKDLYMSGLVCMKCGKGHVITFVVFQFFNFDESVICRNCQNT